MIKLNTIYFPKIDDVSISKEFSLDILKNNELYFEVKKDFLKRYSFTDLTTFSFTPSGFLGLLLDLKSKGTIAISLGETNAVVEAGKMYEKLGFEIIWINLEKDGQVNFQEISNLEVSFLFISSYVMDTFVKTDLERIKNLMNSTIISNGTINVSNHSDIVYFDPYKLVGFNTSGVMLHNDLFTEQVIGYIDTVAIDLVFKALNKQKFNVTVKKRFKECLESIVDDDLYFFVDDSLTLDFTLHFALKDIKARALIRTLSLDEILITNGEGCSLGLSQPSQIIQAMGYSEEISRNGISFSFSEEISNEDIEKVTTLLYKRYRQIKVLG